MIKLRGVLRRYGTAYLELAILCGFAVAQPILDVTGRSPDFFVFRGADRADILLLVVAVTVAPPLLLLGIEVAAGRLGAHASAATHQLLLGAVAGVLVLEVSKRLTPARDAVLVAAGVAGGLAAGILYLRTSWVRLWLRYLIPAPVVFALLFLTVSPASLLVLPAPELRAPAPGVRAGTPVVVIVFDELPLTTLLNARGRIDARVFPNFAKLSRDSTLYRGATGVSRSTVWAVPAMLSGRYPTKYRSPVYAEYPDNLFTLLAGSHELRVFESVTRLCPTTLCPDAGSGRQDGFLALARDTAWAWTQIASPTATTEDPDQAWLVDQTVGEAAPRPDRPASEFLLRDPLRQNQPARFREFLDSLRPSSTPTLHFLHLLLPHAPYRYLPSGLQYNSASRLFGQDGTRWSAEHWPARLARQRHLLQTVFTDRLVGQVLQQLQASGLYDRALIVVTADHGVSFTPGSPRRLLDDGNAAQIAWVPLLIKTPGQWAGRLSDRNVELVDLPATIADLLGIGLPWRSDGISAVGHVQRPAPKSFYNQPGERLALAPAVVRGEADHVAVGPLGLFKVGKHAGMVGTRPGEHSTADGGTTTAEVDSLDLFGRVDPATGAVPAMVSGVIDDSVTSSRPRSVAVSVNGTIGAVAETFQDGAEPARFAAMVPDLLFRSGANTLELFLVEAVEGREVLRPLRLEARSA